AVFDVPGGLLPGPPVVGMIAALDLVGRGGRPPEKALRKPSCVQGWRRLRDDGEDDGENDQRDDQDEDDPSWTNDGGNLTLGRQAVMSSGRQHQQRILPEEDHEPEQTEELTNLRLEARIALDLESRIHDDQWQGDHTDKGGR